MNVFLLINQGPPREDLEKKEKNWKLQSDCLDLPNTVFKMSRNKNYNDEIVLERAMNVFWENGYEGTSVRLLEKEMGINQFSIYASFHNKKNLFIQAIRNYREYIKKHRFQQLLKEDASLPELENYFLGKVNSGNNKGARKGCLIVNTAGELGNYDPDITNEINQHYDFIRNMLLKVLKCAVRKNEIPANTDVEKQASFFLGVMQGISVAGKTMDKNYLKDFIEMALKQLK